jgi:peptidoglycan LD-endopeptidase CwlK
MNLDPHSKLKLNGVHRDLVRVVERAAVICPASFGFVVTEGLRTPERQTQLVAAGASQTMRSRHLTGHAVDLAVVVGHEIRWDWPLYDLLSRVMFDAAHLESVTIEWGGAWQTLRDGPHFQLPRAEYPVQILPDSSGTQTT